MDLLFTLMLCGAGLLMMIYGGDLVVSGSVRLAKEFGLSQFFIGVVLIGFGTSSPELATSVLAAWNGAPGLSYGNVTGSNIANIGLILGVTAFLYGLSASKEVVRDTLVLGALMVGYVLSTFLFPLSRGMGLVYLAVLAVYVWQLRQNDKGATTALGETAVVTRSFKVVLVDPEMRRPIVFSLLGLGLLVLGGHFLVDGAVTLARALHVSESFIGISIVAIGTSLPELVASLQSAKRKAPDLIFGNIIGSNIYNVFGVLGVTGVIAPTVAPSDVLYFHNPVMLLATGGLLFLLVTYGAISKRHGQYMVGGYVTYPLSSLAF
jgi:cation:H+ antiporter